MTTKLLAFTFTILLGLSQPLLLLGQTVPVQNDWATVEALTPGVKLLVETKDGKKLKGKLGSVSVATLSLTGNNPAGSINKDDIQKIYRLSGGSRGKAALIGTAVGAGVGAGGAAIALGSTGGSDDTTGIVAKGVLIGAVIGAVLGLVVGKGSRRVLVYEAK